MKIPDLVYVRCQLSRGGFSSELIFRFDTAQAEEFVGAAPRKYCRTAHGEPLVPEQPPEGEKVSGRVAARIVREEPGDRAWLSFPDGSVALVSKEAVEREVNIP